MPKLLHARAPQDTSEEHKVRKLADSRHAPAVGTDFAPGRSPKNWGATLRKCASASIASTRRDSMALAIDLAPGASRG
jgi:hypothetical protein